MPKALDIVGQRFGRLTVKQRVHVDGARNVMWECICDCGGITIAAAANLGKTKNSCGCLANESARETLKINRLARTDLHGMSQTPEWNTWSVMRERCRNPNNAKYHRYGGRGITVCERWDNSFEDFLADMGPKPSKDHSIDRIDNDGNYEPSNCRWATRKTQGRNTSKNLWITIDGVRLCLEDWCIHLRVPRWKPYEMARATGKNRDKPAKFASVEDAIRHLHAKTLS